jgi:YfiH family protein
MNVPVFLQASNLAQLGGIEHGFFTRHGGVSHGVYESLNCGLGSKDERARVLQNRAYVAGVMDVPANRLVTLYQAHTIECLVIDKPFERPLPQADALVTKAKNLAIAVSTADCTPILLAGPDAQAIGAVHAGWRGAIAGIIPATIRKMQEQGAKPENIVAAIGPVIRQESYEVGQDVISACATRDKNYERFFKPSNKAGHALFDLPGLVATELANAGVINIEDLKRDTYAEETLFFSYRRMTHRKEADYGRHLHAIVLDD